MRSVSMSESMIGHRSLNHNVTVAPRAVLSLFELRRGRRRQNACRICSLYVCSAAQMQEGSIYFFIVRRSSIY